MPGLSAGQHAGDEREPDSRDEALVNLGTP
jgi:hypothetical protein